MEVTAIMSLTSSLKAAGDIANSMLKLRDAAAFQQKAIELNGEILNAQNSALAANAAQAALIEEKRALEKQIVEMKDWARQKERYGLKEIVRGVFAYELKAGVEPPEPTHYVCTNCYEQGKKRILYRQPGDARSVTLDCPDCKTALRVVGAGVYEAGSEGGH